MKKGFIYLFALLGAILSVPVQAGSTITNFQTQSTLSGTCSVQAQNVSFGNLTQSTASPQTIVLPLNFNVLCTNKTAYTVSLGLGNYGSSNGRFIKANTTSDMIQYGICKAYTNTLSFCSAPWWGTYNYSYTGNGQTQVVGGYILTQTGYYFPDNYSDSTTVTVSF